MMEIPKRILKDVPDDQLKIILADFQSEGAVVSALPQKDGKWTIEAVFEDGVPYVDMPKVAS